MRRIGAPRSLQAGVLLGGAILVIGLFIARPDTRPDPTALGRYALVCLVLGVPIIGYLYFFREVKRRAKLANPPAAIAGFELVEGDSALQSNMDAKIIAEAVDQGIPWRIASFSIAYRDDEREVTAAGQVLIIMGIAELKRLWVDKSHRGKGLGTDLLSRLEAEATLRGAKSITLQTFDWQAEGFYRKLGYETKYTTTHDAGSLRYFMTKDLE